MPHNGDTSEKALKERLRARLRALGWTFERLAEETGDSYKNVQRWIGGQTAVRAGFLGRFCEATNTSGDWLLLELGPQERTVDRDFSEGVRYATGLFMVIAAALTDEHGRPLIAGDGAGVVRDAIDFVESHLLRAPLSGVGPNNVAQGGQ